MESVVDENMGHHGAEIRCIRGQRFKGIGIMGVEK
jgi:hypothetical protein